MDLRDLQPEDGDRVRELVDSSLTTAYALSPQQIDAIVADQFGQDAVEEMATDDDYATLVAETDDEIEETAVVGVVVGGLTADGDGEIRWLFVDPEHRGKGIGTELSEAASDELRERGADELAITPLEASTEGPQFAERLGFEQADERDVEVGGESLHEYVYAETESGESADPVGDAAEETDFPDTETRDGQRVTTTEDGEEMYVDDDEEESGTEAAFFAVYEDEDFEKQYGYYCGNCGSTDVSVDQMDRYECGECGNSHAERSQTSYDDGQL